MFLFTTSVLGPQKISIVISSAYVIFIFVYDLFRLLFMYLYILSIINLKNHRVMILDFIFSILPESCWDYNLTGNYVKLTVPIRSPFTCYICIMGTMTRQ